MIRALVVMTSAALLAPLAAAIVYAYVGVPRLAAVAVAGVALGGLVASIGRRR